MQICPHCAKELDDRDIMCAFCGHAANAAGQTPPSPVTVVDKPPAELVVVSRDAAAKAKGSSRNAILASAAIGAIAVVIFIVPRRSNTQASVPAAAPSTAHAASGNVVAPQSAGIAPLDATSAPKWSRTRQPQWATDGSRTIGFEVEAQRVVAVYMDRVRPVLAARCISGHTEVFVVLGTAASIENGGDTHTVRVGLDDQPDVEQQWLDSTDMQALFSPDATALAARMATARRLRFAFKPFNAPPVAVEFDVHGFDAPLAAMAKTCAPAAKRKPTRIG
jgi:zinc-ribbon domain